jgi:DNA invertase Pin-like site-specific DNA recombinase
MIESKALAKRKVRDAKIFKLYQEYRCDSGSKREVASEAIARECKCSVSTVKRITKNLEFNFINGVNAG